MLQKVAFDLHSGGGGGGTGCSTETRQPAFYLRVNMPSITVSGCESGLSFVAINED